jgi:transcriptional regulator with XRE-family HTH domain
MSSPSGGPGLNETLRRALLRARLSEEDVATRLEVDPKTVRRWLEGRVPYMRHRWMLAGVLGLDEADLWPQLRVGQSRPDEVRAIYPHRDAVPRDVWQRLFGSAKREIGILDCSALFLAEDPGVLGVLAGLARGGVKVRICVRDPGAPDVAGSAAGQGADDMLAADVADALAQFGPLLEGGGAEIRLHRDVLYNSIYRADDGLLVSQHAYGIPAGQAPVIHLRRTEDGDMVAAYLESFEGIWRGARPLE